jgi:hypothetical protein
MSYPFAVKSTIEFLTKFPKEMTEEGTPEFGPWTFPRDPDFGKVKGVTIKKGGCYVRIADLTRDYENLGRLGSEKPSHVGALQALIATGRWVPWREQPVVVSTDGRLVAGFHRVEAHENEDKEWVFAYVCEFDTEEDLSAYAVWENNPENGTLKWVTEVSDVAVIAAVKTFNKKKTEEVTTKTVKAYLKCAGVIKKLDATVIEVLDKIGIEYEGVKAHTKKKVAAWAKSDLGIDIYKNVSVVWSLFSGRKETGVTDRELRNAFKIAWRMIKGDNTILISGGITDVDSTEIKKERKYFANIMVRFDELAEAWVAAKRAGTLGKITSYFASQTKTEMEKGKFTKA